MPLKTMHINGGLAYGISLMNQPHILATDHILTASRTVSHGAQFKKGCIVIFYIHTYLYTHLYTVICLFLLILLAILNYFSELLFMILAWVIHWLTPITVVPQLWWIEVSPEELNKNKQWLHLFPAMLGFCVLH